MKVGTRAAKLALVGMVGWAAAFAPLVAAAHPAGAIVAGPSITTTSPLPAGTVSSPYSTTLSASGGSAPYSWSLLSGALPAGLKLSSTGVLTGTPSAPGTSNFTIQVRDSSGATASKPFSLVVSSAVGASPLVITTDSLPDGCVHCFYDDDVEADGGTGTFTFSLAGGHLPPGLHLSTEGSVEGCPTTAGVFKFLVRVNDGAHTVSHAYTVTISTAI